MKNLYYIPFDGDLFTLITNDAGIVQRIWVARDNCSQVKEPVEPKDVPKPVLEKLTNLIMKNYQIHE